MTYTVITTFHEPGLNQYAQRMIDTFEQFWPKEVDLVLCAENCLPVKTRSNTRTVDLLDSSEDLRSFIKRHANNPYAHAQAGPPDVFNPKKAFRWNAVRFCYKVYSVGLIADQIDHGWMIWLDADTHTHSSVPIEWLSTVCPDDSMISYIGRGEKYHSECGWVAYNLNHPKCREFIRDFVNLYNADEIFKLREWHDSYVWDQVRKKYQDHCKFYNLNPSWDDKGLAGHPFINSELGRYMDHVKGKRKEEGMSKPKEVVLHKDLPYWQQVLKKKK